VDPDTLIKDASFSQKAKGKINSTCGSAGERYKRMHYVQGMGGFKLPLNEIRKTYLCL